jgi:hypothetical protein
MIMHVSPRNPSASTIDPYCAGSAVLYNTSIFLFSLRITPGQGIVSPLY